MEIQGVIKDYDGEFLTIVAPFDNTSALEQKCITDCEIRLNDGRSIRTNKDVSIRTGERYRHIHKRNIKQT